MNLTTDNLLAKESAGTIADLYGSSEKPVFLWRPQSKAFAWTNPAAAYFAKAETVDALQNTRFEGTSLAAQLDLINHKLASGLPPRLELLRFPFNGRVLAFVGRVSLYSSNGHEELLIVGPETPAPKTGYFSTTAPVSQPVENKAALPQTQPAPLSEDLPRPEPAPIKRKRVAAQAAKIESKRKPIAAKTKAKNAVKSRVSKKPDRDSDAPDAPVAKAPGARKAVSKGKLEPHERESMAAIARMLTSAPSFPILPEPVIVQDIEDDQPYRRLLQEHESLKAQTDLTQLTHEHDIAQLRAASQKQLDEAILQNTRSDEALQNALAKAEHLQTKLNALQQEHETQRMMSEKRAALPVLQDSETLKIENAELKRNHDETLYVLKEHESVVQDLQSELHQARVLAAELQTILDTATDGIVILDSDAHILSMNATAENLFGEDLTTLEGENLLDLLDPDSQGAALELFHDFTQNPLERRGARGIEVAGLARDGSKIALFLSIGALGGEAPGSMFCAVLRDISRWKHAQIELETARKSAEKASDLKSDFLAKISHEIRTPLNAIIGFSEVMQEERFGAIGSERYKQYINDIHVSGGHLLSLVNDLLDLSKIEAGKLDLVFAPAYVNDLVIQVSAMLQTQANSHGVILRTSLQATPPVVADQRSLRQILLNLLSNAVRFTSSGGQIILSTSIDDNKNVSIRIRDTGIGMSEQEIRQALEPFKQIRSEHHKAERDGTGLGLPISKALADANHALFEIESAPGTGTLVTLTFPASRVLSEQF